MQYQRNFLCLSPQCTAPFERICNFQVLQSHKNCKKWIIRLDEYFQFDNEYISPKKCCLDFYEKPMESIKTIKYLEDGFKLNQFLKKSYELIKNRIDQFLMKMFEEIHSKIAISMIDSLELYREIINIINSQHSLVQINGMLNNSALLAQLRNIQSQGKVNLFNQKQLEFRLNQILTSISQIHEGFIFQECQQSLKNRVNQQIEVKTYLNSIFDINAEGLNQKLQSLYSMFNCKQPPQIQLNSNENFGKSRCFVCEEQIVGIGKNNKQKKKDVFSMTLKHMKKSHQQMITYLYKSKVSKSTSYRISIQSFMKEIYQSQSTKFIVIDRENAGNFQLSFEESNSVYALEIVSRPNEKQAKGRYIIADSNGKDSADLFSVIVIYQLFKVPNSQVQLITKDHYGKTLSQLFEGMGKNLICQGAARIQ